MDGDRRRRRDVARVALDRVADALAFPPVRSLRGTVRVPPSKSASNRALLLAALTESPVEILRPLESDDTRALAACLRAMGAEIVPTERGLRVAGPLRGRAESEIVLDAADSGTAARFLAAAAAAVPGRFALVGSARLSERPMGELVEALRNAGARIEYRGREGGLPLAIEGGRISGGEVTVDASRSSQFLSALLLAAVACEGGLRVRVSGTVASRPYVAATLAALRDFGHEAREGDGFLVRRGAKTPAEYAVPGDYSSAVPLVAAVGAAGGEVTLSGLRWPSADADAAAIPVLETMGVRIEAGPDRLRATSDGSPSVAAVAAADFPDAVPSLAALAMFAPGESRFTGIGHLRLKESDRLASIEALAEAAGARARSSADALIVAGPARPHSPVARVPTFRDHRIAMAGAILSLRVPGLLIDDPGCVAKSYPEFFRDLESLARR